MIRCKEAKNPSSLAEKPLAFRYKVVDSLRTRYCADILFVSEHQLCIPEHKTQAEQDIITYLSTP